MATDIYSVIERSLDSVRWDALQFNPYIDPDYSLFNWLAGARRDRASVKLAPICAPRGLPSDAAPETVSYFRNRGPLAGHSWHTFRELYEARTKIPEAELCGIMGIADYRAWNKKSKPKLYYQGVSGPDVVVSDENCIQSDTTDVRFSFSIRPDFQHFFDVLEKYAIRENDRDRVRIVFGFD